MRSTKGMTTLQTFTKNFVNSQNYDGVTVKLNAASAIFDATYGYGQAAASSTLVFLNFGGFDSVKCTATMQYPSPTTAGTEDLGVVLGATNVETLGAGANYLYARVNAGSAKIVTVIDGVFATLTTAAWSVAQGVSFTIDFTRVGRLLTATFTAVSGPSPVTLSYTLPANSTLLVGGLVGFRSLSKAVWCSSLRGDQLA